MSLPVYIIYNEFYYIFSTYHKTKIMIFLTVHRLVCTPTEE